MAMATPKHRRRRAAAAPPPPPWDPFSDRELAARPWHHVDCAYVVGEVLALHRWRHHRTGAILTAVVPWPTEYTDAAALEARVVRRHVRDRAEAEALLPGAAITIEAGTE